MFPDMPWMLSIDSRPTEIREAATAAFGDSPAKRGRLFAFGYDAFRLAESLKRGSSIDPKGLTGTLSLDAQGRVRRELEWVRIKSGTPTPLSPQDAVATAAPAPQ
jgi:outer membrane PBP1 activator LpoA protein